MTVDLTQHVVAWHPDHASELGPRQTAESTLLDLFDITLLTWGERTAVDAPDGVLDYRGLAAAADSLAQRLRSGGVGPGDRVGVRVPSGSAQLYVAVLGVLSSGAAYVPVDADDPAARAEQVMGEAKVCAVVGEGLELDWRAPAGGRSGRPAPDDDAWIIFTSGSTGTPKGVAVTHRAAAAFVAAESELWQVFPEDRVLAGLSVAFDASCEEMWLAWAHGAALVPAPRQLVRSGAELGPWLCRRGVSVISTVPTLAAIWDDAALVGVRLLILGGEACPERLAWRLAADREVWNTYGPTEATVVSTAVRLRPGEPVTIGAPLRGWQIAVVDDAQRPVRDGVEGELVIGGIGLGRYLDDELDRQRFAPLDAVGWDRAYRTGDIVRKTPGGLEYVGRRDHQVKIGGRRIELGEVDAQLTAIPGVRAACTVVRETAAGNKLLVGYVAADAEPEAIRSVLAQRMPTGLVALIVTLDELPVATSGKVSRDALPWPPPPGSTGDAGSEPGLGRALSETERWLAERWREQLGPIAIPHDGDFFALGGSSLAAAKLTSQLRERYPALAVADIYNHRGLSVLAARLDQLNSHAEVARVVPTAGSARWGLVQLAGLFGLIVLTVPQWLLAILALDRFFPGQVGPRVAWGWLVLGWVVFGSAPARALLVAGARRMLLPRLRPGRYPRNGWLACRLWFLEQLATHGHLDTLAGTPWAARYARLAGHSVGAGARLGTLPPVGSLVTIGEGATIEGEVDMYGWWMESSELVVGEVTIGAGARVATRTLLMPGTVVGTGAEVEPGSVVTGLVPAGERWSGSPAAQVGRAGEHWPSEPPPAATRARLWKVMYAIGLGASELPALLAAVPGILLILAFVPGNWSTLPAALTMVAIAPAIAGSFVIAYAVIVAAAVRLLGSMVTPGWHPGLGRAGWALWFTESLMSSARDLLFPLYASVFTRPWLRLAGLSIGPRAEISTAVGISSLTEFGEGSFAADDVVMAVGRGRDGWLCVEPITIGHRTFMGNGAILGGGTTIGDDSLIGLLTIAPPSCAPGTSWLGAPALELPRRRCAADPRRTTDPSRRLVLARAATELVRILLPATISVALAGFMFDRLDAVGVHDGLWIMAAATPFILLAASLCAVAITIVIKWVVIGRYRSGDHPLWSFFVWRDEIVNSCQESLAGAWLLNSALGTPLMRVYLRLMGAKVGRDVWCETLTITEFDLAELGDGAVVNRNAVVETHLFHDRVMQIGPARLGAGATLGPSSAMLPDTEIGDGCSVGGRSVVMRGERLPAGTRWHGSPVVSA
jgi:non-ribosomal peptide synthetase-like protein